MSVILYFDGGAGPEEARLEGEEEGLEEGEEEGLEEGEEEGLEEAAARPAGSASVFFLLRLRSAGRRGFVDLSHEIEKYLKIKSI